MFESPMNVEYYCCNVTADTDEEYARYLGCAREYASRHNVQVRIATRQKFHENASRHRPDNGFRVVDMGTYHDKRSLASEGQPLVPPFRSTTPQGWTTDKRGHRVYAGKAPMLNLVNPEGYGHYEIEERHILGSIFSATVPQSQEYERDTWQVPPWEVIDCRDALRESKGKCVMVSCDDVELAPGERTVLAANIMNDMEKELTNNFLCFPSDTVAEIDHAATQLYDAEAFIKTGYLIENRTAATITVPRDAKLADIELLEGPLEEMYAVTDSRLVDAFARLKEVSESGWHKVLRLIDQANARQIRLMKASVPEVDEEQGGIGRYYILECRRSRFARFLYQGLPDLRERMAYINEHFKYGEETPLTYEQMQEVKLLAMCFADRVCMATDDLPLAQGVEPFRVNTGNNRPAKQKMRVTPFAARDFLKKEIEMLKKINAITEVRECEYGAPVRMVAKPDGSWRLCFDYRWLNQTTMIPAYPMPRLEDLISRVKGKPYMATFDLTKAYWQMPVAKEDRHKTTFVCEFGNYEFNRVPMGIAGAVPYYQAAVKQVLEEIEYDRKKAMMVNYIDDVVVAAEDYDSFIEALQCFLQAMRGHNIAISVKKSLWGAKSIEYLGFVVDSEVWYPSPKRVQALLERSPPTTLKELRGFTAAVSFYMRFIPNSQHELEPLYDLLRGLDEKMSKRRRNSPKIDLGEKARDAFDRVLKLLKEKLILWHIDPAKDFYLFVDASDTASGSCLMQYVGADLRPVAFHSQVFAMAQRNYATSERELLGVIHALKKYHSLLYRGPVTHVYTDHKSLIALMVAKTDATPRLERWRTNLQAYNLKWYYIEGKKNGLADFLSRPSEDIYKMYEEYIMKVHDEADVDEFDYRDENPKMCFLAQTRVIGQQYAAARPGRAQTTRGVQADGPWFSTPPQEYAPEWHEYIWVYQPAIARAQSRCDDCETIKRHIRQIEIDPDWKPEDAKDPLFAYARRCKIIESTLVAESLVPGRGYVTVIPRDADNMRYRIFEAAHAGERGHLRNPKLRILIAQSCDWPSLKTDVNRWLNSCIECLQYDQKQSLTPVPGAFIAEDRFDQFTIDVMKMQHACDGHDRILGVVDTCTRFCWAIPMKDEKAETQIHALNQYVYSMGRPKLIIADKHPVYKSMPFLNWAMMQGTAVHLPSGYSSTHVSLVNRLHKTLRSMLVKSRVATGDWLTALPVIMHAFNDTVNPSTGYAPMELMMYKRTRTPVDNLVGYQLSGIADDIEPARAREFKVWELARAEATERMRIAWKQAKQKYVDQIKNPNRLKISVGDIMLRRVPNEQKKAGKDAPRRYWGPYRVVDLVDDGVHALIVPLAMPMGPPERVHRQNLIPNKDRYTIGIYPTMEISDMRGPANPKEAIFVKREEPKHDYKTRSKEEPQAEEPGTIADKSRLDRSLEGGSSD